MRKVNQLVIHHSATSAGSVEEFRQQHIAVRGWSDIGYHRLIGNGRGSPEGEIKQGRPDNLSGAGVYGNNRGKLHVVVVGNFEAGHSGFTGPPTPRQLGALGHLLLAWGKQYKPQGLNGLVIVGHKEIALPGHGTVCPGNQMPLHRIRTWYDENLVYFVRNSEPIIWLNDYLSKNG